MWYWYNQFQSRDTCNKYHRSTVKPLCAYLCAIAIVVSPVTLGGEFVNLTFDEPDLNGSLVPLLPDGPFIGSATDLLRGWSASANGVPFGTIAYSPYRQPLFGAMIILSERAPSQNLLYLDSVGEPDGPEIRISQRGTIPANAISLLTYPVGSGISGYANDKFIGEIDVNHSIAHWDVRAFAGQEVELSIVLRGNSSGAFDILGFEMIPEPSTTALFVVGGLGLGWMIFSKGRSRPSGK